MSSMRKRPAVKKLLTATLILCAGTVCYAQNTKQTPALPGDPSPAGCSMTGLNSVGNDVSMPPFSDSVVSVNSSFRRSLCSKGMALRFVWQGQYIQNMLNAPVSADEQAYAGERPFGWVLVNPIFTTDLRQLGLHHAQLEISGSWNWVSWNPAGPKVLSLRTMYFYKAFDKGLIELKAGYDVNDLEFVGLQVGGSIANAVQGVYAVIPFEVGMSHYPLPAPTFNIRIQGPRNTYLKVAAQRSLDPAGGPTTAARNSTGFRFDPNGDKLLLISELGYRRAASTAAHEAWFRAGYLHNSTPYTNLLTGQRQPGNYAAYVLMDYQLLQPDAYNPDHGLYVGTSVMTAPAKFNAYDRYYEGRLYLEGPFRSRPGDVLSLVISHTGYSTPFINKLVAAGKSVWRSSSSATASYSIHVAPGQHLTLGLSYVHGPAITPRVPSALTFNATYGLFF